MTAWTIGKYALALAGLAIVVGANRLGRPAFGYAGLVLIAAAFLLRFVERSRR